MKLGRISLNVAAIADISEQDFYTLVKGSIDIDKKEAWKLFCKEAGRTIDTIEKKKLGTRMASIEIPVEPKE